MPANGPVVGIVVHQLLLHVQYHVRILQLFPSFIEAERVFMLKERSLAFMDYVNYPPERLVVEAREKIKMLITVWGVRHEEVLMGVLSALRKDMLRYRTHGVGSGNGNMNGN